jgi:type IV pilus assembly protein PilY1
MPAAEERLIITLGETAAAEFVPSAYKDLTAAQQDGLAACAGAGPAAGSAADASGGSPWPPVAPACAGRAAGALPADAERAGLAADRIRYLRGGDDDEYRKIDLGAQENGASKHQGRFRARTHRLGDIVNGNIEIVGPPSARYADAGYQAFREEQQARPTMIYLGANDGMLHAFEADTGVERFAYVPAAVYPGLAALTSPAYGDALEKRAFVDGRLRHADAYFARDGHDLPEWHTVLLGRLGLGGQAVFALDVTQPGEIGDEQPQRRVLWEFDDASANSDGLDGRDLGFGFAAPAVVRIDQDLADSQPPVWVALVANGYQSTAQDGAAGDSCGEGAACTVGSGHAVLYVLNLGGGDDRRILAKLDTGAGSLGDEAGAQAGANGLAGATALDNDGDLVADVAYAGDLHGNLWRFDLTDLDVPPKRLFQARGPDGGVQPITLPVAYRWHPSGVGVLVLFGTGLHPGLGEVAGCSVQSIYAIWDRGDALAARITRSELVEQAIVPLVPDAGADPPAQRLTTAKPADWSYHRGWFLDLTTPSGGETGERLAARPQVRGGVVRLRTWAPASGCDAAGRAWVNRLRSADGARPARAGFDTNGDGVLDDADRVPMSASDGGAQTVAASAVATASAARYEQPLLDLGGGRFARRPLEAASEPVPAGPAGLGRRNWRRLR